MERTTLNAILGGGATYRQDGSIVEIADDATEIQGDVTIDPGCVHDWADADCDTPKSCNLCGATEGAYQNATAPFGETGGISD